MKVGFIGLGNVGGKLAGSLLRNNFDLTVRDLDKNLTKSFEDLGAKVANSAKELAEKVDLIITCLPSTNICAEVMEADDGVINGLSENKIWLEMSTTDESEIKRISKKMKELFNLVPRWGKGNSGQTRAWIKITSMVIKSTPINSLNIKSSFLDSETDKVLFLKVCRYGN